MTPFRLKFLPFCIAAFISAPASAVGLGDIELHSPLGKPLEAVIPLSHLGDLGADQLRVGLGSEDDYSKLGVEQTYQHSLIRLEPFVRDGKGYVRLITRDPVNEPYLNFVLNLRWPQGQVVREYTVLLDPPGQSVAAAPAIEAAPDDSVPAQTAPSREPVAQTQAAEPAPASGDTYVARSGDSLWRLAARWRPAGVGIDQMMSAIHQANPDAFVDNDPAKLRATAQLRVPSAEQIAAAGPLQTAPTETPARALAAEPITPDDSAPEPEPLPTGISSGARDEELVAENAALKSQVSELSNNVATLTDNLTASQERLHDLEAKIGALVDQLERQRVATQALATAAGVAPKAGDAVVNEANAGDLLAPAPAKTPWWVHVSYWVAIGGLGAWVASTQWARRRRPVLAELELPRDTGSARAAAEIEARLAAEPVVQPAATRPADYWKHTDNAGDIGELPLDLVDVPQVTDAVPRERPSFADATVIRTAEDSVDPIISAGVFTAFGRYEDAEQVLVEAIQRHPERADLKLHLLDIYKQQDSRDAFSALADVVEQDHADDEATQLELSALRRQYMA